MKYNIVITAGGTSEKIDNVRRITNSASGKLGSLIAQYFCENYNNKINKIYYICSPTSFKPSSSLCEIIEIVDTNDLKIAVEKVLSNNKIDCFIHSMAVSDYTVDYVTTVQELSNNININNIEKSIVSFNKGFKDTKISSSIKDLIIKLKPTPKIINLIKKISPNTMLVGFKLLDNVSEKKLIDVAKNLMQKNDCDVVVANDQKNISLNYHKAFIIDSNFSITTAQTKNEIAEKLCKKIICK